MNKEVTFAKVVERTSKLCAYEQAITIVENWSKEDAIKYLRDKAKNHADFLDNTGCAYDFSTQNLHVHFDVSRFTGLPGVAMNEPSDEVKR